MQNFQAISSWIHFQVKYLRIRFGQNMVSKIFWFGALQEIILDRFLLWLGSCNGAKWQLPEKAAVRTFLRGKQHLRHQPSTCFGCESEIWVRTNAPRDCLIYQDPVYC